MEFLIFAQYKQWGDKMKRKIIEIDEHKCDGCGLCIPECPEGAIQIIDEKAQIPQLYVFNLGFAFDYLKLFE